MSDTTKMMEMLLVRGGEVTMFEYAKQPEVNMNVFTN
jgi:hypothetical protein